MNSNCWLACYTGRSCITADWRHAFCSLALEQFWQYWNCITFRHSASNIFLDKCGEQIKYQYIRTLHETWFYIIYTGTSSLVRVTSQISQRDEHGLGSYVGNTKKCTIRSYAGPEGLTTVSLRCYSSFMLPKNEILCCRWTRIMLQSPVTYSSSLSSDSLSVDMS